MTLSLKPSLEEVFLSHISERPWSTYTKADYTPEQWHRACLIHQHQGAPMSKNQCKLPVRTPNGALNRNGVHSALAAINGARGGVDATTAEKIAARAAVAKLYKELGEEAPGFSAEHSFMIDDEVLQHFGIKGMKWGQRKARDSSGQNQGMSTAKKAAIGSAVVAGVAATAFVISRFGGTKLPAPNLSSVKSATNVYHPDMASYMKKIDAGQVAHERTMSLLRYKKTELDNVASLARIDKLLKQPTPKMPTFESLVKSEQRSRRVSSIKGFFNRSSKPPTQLFPAQSILKSKSKSVTDMSDLNSGLMKFTDDALQRGGTK